MKATDLNRKRRLAESDRDKELLQWMDGPGKKLLHGLTENVPERRGVEGELVPTPSIIHCRNSLSTSTLDTMQRNSLYF